MARIDLVSNLLPGGLSAEGRRLQELTRAASAQQAGGESLLGGITGMTAVAPAASQQKRNLAGLFSALPGVDIDVRSPIEKINDQLAQAGVSMNTSAGQFMAAKLAQQAGLSQQALQLGSSASELQQKERAEASKAMNFTNLQNALLQTSNDPRDVAQIRAASNYEELETIRERLAPGGEAENPNYSIETPSGQRTVLALPTDKDGNIFYNNKWNKPDTLKAIKVGDDLSKVSSSLGGTPPPDPTQVDPDPLMEYAIRRNYIPPGTNPDGERLLRAIMAGQVTSIEGVETYYEGDVTTPAAIQQKATNDAIRSQQILQGSANELNSVERALSIVNDPEMRVGGLYTLTTDLPAIEKLNEDQIALNALLTSIKSDEALNRIEELKAVSAELGGEGTGLGSVQIKEFEALQSAIASLPANGNKDIWRPGLEKIKFHLMNIALVNQGQDPYVDISNPAYASTVMIHPDTKKPIVILDPDTGAHYEVRIASDISTALEEMTKGTD